MHHDNDFGVVFELLGEIMGDPKYLKRKIGFIEPKRKQNLEVSRNARCTDDS